MTCITCTVNLIILGILGGVYALSGFDLLSFLCFGNTTAVRITLAIDLVSALFMIYALLVLRPYRGYK